MTEDFLKNGESMRLVESAGQLLAGTIRRENKIIACGNGGSMCDAMHFAEELAGKFREERSPLPCLAISDPAYLSCTANDYGWEMVFSRYVEAFGKENDLLFCISTSGDSENILQAISASKNKKMKVIGLSGGSGGNMAGQCDILICSPPSRYSDRIQEIHIKVIHALIRYIESELKMNVAQ